MLMLLVVKSQLVVVIHLKLVVFDLLQLDFKMSLLRRAKWPMLILLPVFNPLPSLEVVWPARI